MLNPYCASLFLAKMRSPLSFFVCFFHAIIFPGKDLRAILLNTNMHHTTEKSIFSNFAFVFKIHDIPLRKQAFSKLLFQLWFYIFSETKINAFVIVVSMQSIAFILPTTLTLDSYETRMKVIASIHNFSVSINNQIKPCLIYKKSCRNKSF